VTARKVQRVAVKIFKVTEGTEVEIYKCAQRDLFSKYGWPAKDGIKKAVLNNK
jgi:hypothetical protein